MFGTAKLDGALKVLGDLLADRGHHFAVVAIGGAGLHLIGLIDRPTKDIDLVALVEDDKLVSVGRSLPPPLAEAVVDVGRILNLAADWMNSGPAELLSLGLPAGFRERLLRKSYGGGLDLFLASRLDQIHFKLYAAADGDPGDKHHADLKRMGPSREELQMAAQWARTHDPSEGFAIVLAGVLRDFGIED
jgi:hypothetical protein